MANSQHINGDLSVGRNVAVGGKTTIQGNAEVGHNLKVKGWLEAPNIKDVNKGVFTSLAALNAAYPNPKNGWVAGVLTSTTVNEGEENEETVYYIQLYAAYGGAWVAQTNHTMEFKYDFEQPLEELYQKLVDNAIGGITCSTAADVAIKEVVTELGGAGLIDWATFKVIFAHANTSSNTVTLKVTDGENPPVYIEGELKYNGAAVSATNTWDDGEVCDVTFNPGDDNTDATFNAVPIRMDSIIDTEHLKDAAVTTAKIANENVTTAKIADSNVTTAKLADGNVTTAKIANAAVTTKKIADGNVTTDNISDAAVVTSKIADSNVTTAKIADSNVTTQKIADGNVTTAKIADENVTWAKLDENTKQLIYAPGGVRIPLAQEFGNDEHIGISQKVLTESRNDLQHQIDAITTTVDLSVSQNAIFVGITTQVTLTATSSRTASTIKVEKDGEDMPDVASDTDHLTVTDSLTPETEGTTRYKAKFVINGYNKDTTEKTVTAVNPIYYGSGSSVSDFWEGGHKVKFNTPTTSPYRTYNVTVRNDRDKVYFAVPSSMEIHRATMNGFDFPLDAPDTSISGYRIYPSSNTYDATDSDTLNIVIS